jgi:ADP-ribose pyrophosphatase YjhB (NUDIX family)
MEVVRVEADGLGLAFTSGTGRHLWQSVERLRTELAIGRDYFQVHVNALVVAPGHGLLLVRQHGPWALPGMFLVVGENWQRYLQAFLERELKVEIREVGDVVGMRSAGSVEVPEAATLNLFVEVRAAGGACDPPPEGRYRAARWVARQHELGSVTLASEEVREIAATALSRLEDGGGAS